jgi:hypothetical protein
MDELPSIVPLFDCWNRRECEARYVRLTRALAQGKIDGAWWRLDGISAHNRAAESDHHWHWSKLVGGHRNDLVWECMAIQTADDEIQGAICYRIDGRSFVSPDLGTVYIDRIAAAPRNRPWLTPKSRYRGVGTGLLLGSVCHSHTLGLGGRINLHSVPDERTQTYYKKRGFTCIGHPPDDDMVEYELTAEAAQSWLRKEGYLG